MCIGKRRIVCGVGGFLVTDNALRRGRVADSSVQSDAEIDAVREFNALMSNDPRFQTTVLPLRDGVTVALRFVIESDSSVRGPGRADPTPALQSPGVAPASDESRPRV
jgi:hypothetical protein